MNETNNPRNAREEGFGALLSKIMPTQEFDPTLAPPAPEYSDPASWAVRPGREAKSTMVPSNRDCRDAQSEAEVDCFFIHPTTYFGKHNWNADINDQRSNEWVDELVIPAQASAFNGCARIFAPRYRQATLYSFIDRGPNGRKALEFAFEDVVRAFEHFIEHENNGRPFIIAGHSQGSNHGIRLLEEKIDGTELFDRLVSAFVIGQRIPADKFGRTLSQIQMSEKAEDLGTVVTWDTIQAGFEDMVADMAVGHYYPEGWEASLGKEKVAVNPLLWQRGTDEGPTDLHQGVLRVKSKNINMAIFYDGVPMGVDTYDMQIVDGFEISTRNVNGQLIAASNKPERLSAIAGPGGSLHNFDYSLFYMNIRENAALRVQRFLEGRS
ncbi:MAG: DUF3089 domain-containing protein [Alphaproteobacteria bacterium]|nr:MAG: DUF3089 domain-containing protein [Alphaproteobacteria bacterium]